MIMLERLTVLAMIQNEDQKIVVLQADIKESTRMRLKLQAVRLGTTMSSLADQILSEGLDQLEKQQ
jgi:class 3 adenylate cyclase